MGVQMMMDAMGNERKDRNKDDEWKENKRPTVPEVGIQCKMWRKTRCRKGQGPNGENRSVA